MRQLLPAAVLLLTIVATASAQSLPPPSRPAAVWDTQILVNEAHNLAAEALPDLRRRAEDGDARSQVILGLVLEMGSADQKPQPAEALTWFLKAAAQSVAWAEMWAADFYFSGSQGVPKDMYKALEMYKSAAGHGDTRAAFFVGQMYFFGDGVSTNQPEAASWFRRAIPADPDTVTRMVALSEAGCDSKFCVALRQVVGAMMIGLADRFTVGLIPRFGFKDADGGRGSAAINAGDLTLQAQYQLTQFEEDHWLPTISVNLGETLPVGAYDRLDRASNGFGAGAYTTTLSLYSQTYFWMPGGRIMRTRLNLSYALSNSVDLMDRSVYGTMPGFRGHAAPGASAVADLAFEYSIDRNWVAAMDFWLEQDENTRVTGSYPGAPQSVNNSGRARVFYVAPAIEYNFSSSFGVILGARIFAAGENQTATVTPVIAFNYVH